MKIKAYHSLLLLLAATAQSRGEDITLLSSDAFGESSFVGGARWPGGAAPVAGNNYFTGEHLLRTPASAGDKVFAGDRLTVNPTNYDLVKAFMFKGPGYTATVNDLVVDGGYIRHAEGEAQLFILAGNLSIGANGARMAVQGPMEIASLISGTGTISIDSPGSGSTARTVTFSNPGNTFTGTLDVTTGGGAPSRFVLSESGVLPFVLGTGGTYNLITGAGTVAFNGTFAIDLTGASTEIGMTYTLVNTASLIETYGGGFNVQGWTRKRNTWISPDGNYYFDMTSGNLVRVETDSDYDLLPDEWELTYFDSINDWDDTGDPDSDFSDNLSEYLASTHPDLNTEFPDSDADGLPDGWEITFFGNLAQTADGDPDNDYSTNLEEYAAFTSPTLRTIFPDGDFDGISDGWEEHFFTTKEDCNPGVDSDGDLFDNLTEFLAATHPVRQTASPDLDNDRLPDGWEVKYFRVGLESLEAATARKGGTVDTDLDGRNDLMEYHLGTNPLVPDTAPPTLAYWRFEERATGAVPSPQIAGAVSDVSGNGNDMITFADYTAPTYSTRVTADGFVENTEAMNFSSMAFIADAGNRYTSDNIYTPAAAPINTAVFSAYTVEASFRTTLAGVTHGIIGKGGNPTGAAAPYQAPFTLKISAAGQVVAGMVDSVPSAHEVASTRTVTTGQWYTAAVTISSTTLSLWLKTPGDSEYILEGSTAINGASPTTGAASAWVIGQTEFDAAGNFGGFDSFTGDLDEIRISGRLLASGELLANVASGTADSDNDGMDDSWEDHYFEGRGQTAEGDFDNDGTDNLTEFRLGLIPNDGSSRFAATLAPGGVLAWPSALGVRFTIMRSETLGIGSWTQIGTVNGTSGTATFTDPAPPAGSAFYKVLLEP